jgi:dihydrofolate reductase
MTLAHIVAVARNNVIGDKNTLPWDLPEDMKFFRDKTKGRALIMGRKTFESVGHPLPNRLNVVVTRQPDFKATPAPNVHVCANIKEAVAFCADKISTYGDEIFIIGGGEIYKQSLAFVDTIYLTRIHRDFPGEVYYPALPDDVFDLVEKRDIAEPIPFSFLTYRRKRTQ